MAFNFFKKKEPVKESIQASIQAGPLGYWEEESYMIAFPEELPRDILTKVKDRLEMVPGATLTGFRRVHNNDWRHWYRGVSLGSADTSDDPTGG